MEEDDHDELLQCSDEDSLSESGDDQCIPPENKPEELHIQAHTYSSHTKLEFLTVKATLILSTTALLIILPLYQEVVNLKADAYTIIYFNSTFAVIGLLLLLIVARRICRYRGHVQCLDVSIAKPPLKWKEIVISSAVYTCSGFIVIYALDRKKVLCHLQDPIKGLVLVFSLIYYFFFCKKLMGLQRIFSATTIIVGLFISVDYGLCDEFRCRGNDREHKSDDAGTWTWQAHSIWATVYIFGLALFSAYYMFLDRFLICSLIVSPYSSLSSQLLSTISRLVSSQSSNDSLTSNPRTLATTRINKKYYSALHLAFWIHVFTWIFTVALFWTDFLPHLGNAKNITEFFNHTTAGMVCMFSVPETGGSQCGNVSIYAWLFLMFYMIFTISSLRFLILSQSAVYTIAVMTASLPLIGIWWSLFKMVPISKGLLMWSPTLSGELICGLLGLPIIMIGLALFCKSHFKDCQMIQLNANCIPTHLA